MCELCELKLQPENILYLSEKDQIRFAEILLNPPKPNSRLKKLMIRANHLTKDMNIDLNKELKDK